MMAMSALVNTTRAPHPSQHIVQRQAGGAQIDDGVVRNAPEVVGNDDGQPEQLEFLVEGF